MPVRLTRAYNGQPANTIYTGPDESLLKSVSGADDQLELATDYAYYRLAARGATLRGTVSSANSPAQLTPPPALRWTAPGIGYTQGTSGYSYTGEVTGPYRVWGAVRLYVDLTNATGNASDSNAGTAQGAPLATLSAARGKVNTNGTEIIVFGHKQDVVVKETATWTAGAGFDYRMINRELPYRVSLLRVASATAPTWAATSGQPGVYETTISAADASSLVDMATKVDMAARIVTPVGGTAADAARYAAIVRAAPPCWQVPVAVGSVAAVAAQPGSRYHDGTKLYVQAADSRNLVGSATMLPLAAGVFARSATNRPNAVQGWRGFDFIGGAVPFFATSGADNVQGCVYVLEDCSTQASAPGGSGGWQVTGVPRVVLVRCAAWNNWNDGYNYHAFTTNNLDAGPFVQEVECVAGGNGTTGSNGGSDNDSTAHEKTDVVTQNCVFLGSSDRVIADIQVSRRYMLGGYVGAPIGTDGISLADVATADSAQIYIDGTQFAPAGANAVNLRGAGDGGIFLRSYDTVATRAGNVGTYT